MTGRVVRQHIAQLPTGPLPDSYRPTARALFPRVEQITGDGPWAVIVSFYGRTFIVLWSTVDDALDAKLHVDAAVKSSPGFRAFVTVHDLRLFLVATGTAGAPA